MCLRRCTDDMTDHTWKREGGEERRAPCGGRVIRSEEVQYY